MDKVLLLIGGQKEYFKGGKLEVYQSNLVLYNITRVLKFFRNQHLPVFHIQHVNLDQNTKILVPNTEGAKFCEELQPLWNEETITKFYSNGFYGTELGNKLEKIPTRNLIICGCLTHQCIDATARAASDLGFYITVISDACGSLNLNLDNISFPAILVNNIHMASLQDGVATIITTSEFLEFNQSGEKIVNDEIDDSSEEIVNDDVDDFEIRKYNL